MFCLILKRLLNRARSSSVAMYTYNNIYEVINTDLYRSMVIKVKRVQVAIFWSYFQYKSFEFISVYCGLVFVRCFSRNIWQFFIICHS